MAGPAKSGLTLSSLITAISEVKLFNVLPGYLVRNGCGSGTSNGGKVRWASASAAKLLCGPFLGAVTVTLKAGSGLRRESVLAFDCSVTPRMWWPL